VTDFRLGADPGKTFEKPFRLAMASAIHRRAFGTFQRGAQLAFHPSFDFDGDIFGGEANEIGGTIPRSKHLLRRIISPYAALSKKKTGLIHHFRDVASRDRGFVRKSLVAIEIPGKLKENKYKNKKKIGLPSRNLLCIGTAETPVSRCWPSEEM